MKSVVIVCFCFCLFTVSFAQEQEPEFTLTEKLEQKTQAIEESLKAFQKLKISGYVQTQYQWGEKDALLRVGNANNSPDESFNRIGVRRGRIKFAYEEGLALGVFQLDMTEKGVGIKDAYLGIKDAWIGTNILKAGIFDRPFGNEISYSSSRRESPERSTIFQTLFPDERDLGASLILQAAKTSPWNFLKLEAGLFAGNSINQETDNRKDFIGHLSATKNIGSNVNWGLGISYYNGGVFQGAENVYTMVGNSFVLDNALENKGQFAKREYVGFDGQFSIMNILGLSRVRSEYLFGTQPGSMANSKSPNSSSPIVTDTYLRNFSGGYVIFIQDLGRLPLSAVLKYDWYDPNTKVAKNDIGLNGTGVADLRQTTFGFGILWRVTNNIRLQAYYELNDYEKTDSQIINNIESDIFTLRLQCGF